MQIAKQWRLKGPRYRLEGVRHRSSGAVLFPPPAVLDDAVAYEPVSLSGYGVIESFAVVGRAPDGFVDGSVLALVRLAEGPLVTAQLTDVERDAVQIGMEVEMVTRKLRDLGPDGLIVYGYKFRPVLPPVTNE